MRHTDMDIRTARRGDTGELVSLLRELFGLEEDFSFDPVRQERGIEMLLSEAGAGASLVLAAESDGRVAGMCTGQILVSTAEGGPAILVEDVVVSPAFRGQGAGRALLGALENWAQSRGATRMQLLADKDNTQALEFYAHMGWEPTNLVCLRRRIAPEDHA